jgi:hypothetical protein
MPGQANLSGKTYSAWVFLPNVAPSSTSGTTCSLHAKATGFVDVPLSGAGATKAPVVLGSWFQLSGTLPTTAAAQQIETISVECVLPSGWNCCQDPTHVWYVDDIQIN